ncbi:hypothetical protein TNCV_2032811 [Trichonephila clavipes]|nr:hypothetical protein TNCV_2032811 [Trichonephila clavipes]
MRHVKSLDCLFGLGAFDKIQFLLQFRIVRAQSTMAVRVPLLNARHRAACLAWAREHRDCSIEDWKRVAWYDESRFRVLNETED